MHIAHHDSPVLFFWSRCSVVEEKYSKVLHTNTCKTLRIDWRSRHFFTRTHNLSRSLSLSLSLTLSLSLSFSLSLALARSRSLSLALSRTHAHTHTHIPTRTHTQITLHDSVDRLKVNSSKPSILYLERMTKPEFNPSVAGNLQIQGVCGL